MMIEIEEFSVPKNKAVISYDLQWQDNLITAKTKTGLEIKVKKPDKIYKWLFGYVSDSIKESIKQLGGNAIAYSVFSLDSNKVPELIKDIYSIKGQLDAKLFQDSLNQGRTRRAVAEERIEFLKQNKYLIKLVIKNE